MHFISRLIIVISVILLPFSFTYAQQSSNQNGKNGSDSTRFHLFFEKVYLHLDRQYYASGDDIWFKAYLVNGQSNWLTNSSNSLYVELIAPDSKLMSREVIRLDNGVGMGDFKLKDSIPGGKYRIRAYTNWIRNFGDCFIFEKEIEIHDISGAKTKIAELNPDSTKIDIRFFPEGGSLIANVGCIVAFKAVDVTGKGCEVSGKVISSKGDTVGWFQSIHLGMGTFNFLPLENERYYAVGKTKNNTSFKIELPAVLSKGFALRVNNNDTANLIVSIITNQETINQYNNQEMLLLGQSCGKKYFSGIINIKNLQTNVKVPKSKFPVGIACITLYDSELRPQSERLAFIEQREKITVSVIPDKKIYKPREGVTLTVKATDHYKRPVKANLSLSVVDAGQVPSALSNIVSYLMLESEIKGKIEQSMMYFDTTNANRYKQLNLLLLTQGWRDFLWKRLDSVRIKYMVEPGITISGRVRQKFVNKSIPDANVTLFLPDAKKNKLMFTKSDSIGRYFFDGIEFYGKKHLIISSKNQKGKDAGWVLRDSLFAEPITIPVKPLYRTVKPDDDLFGTEADSRKNILKQYKFADTIHLKEVIITSKRKEEEQTKKHLIEAGGMVDFDLKITPDDYSIVDISGYLMAHVPGADYLPYNPQNPDDRPNRVGFRSAGELLAPRYILDGFNMRDSNDDELVYSLAVEQIDRIIVSRSDRASGQPNRYVISIYTNPNAMEKKDFSVVDERINGYYESRIFYSPKYDRPKEIIEKPDLRPTIYWNPNVMTNAFGEATVRFYNSDKLAKVNTVVEGITEKGIPVAGAGSYNIK